MIANHLYTFFSNVSLSHISRMQWVTQVSPKRKTLTRCSWKWFALLGPIQMIPLCTFSAATIPAASLGLELSTLTRSVFKAKILSNSKKRSHADIILTFDLGHLWVSNVWTARVSLLLHRVCKSVSQRTRLQVSCGFLGILKPFHLTMKMNIHLLLLYLLGWKEHPPQHIVIAGKNASAKLLLLDRRQPAWICFTGYSPPLTWSPRQTVGKTADSFVYWYFWWVFLALWYKMRTFEDFRWWIFISLSRGEHILLFLVQTVARQSVEHCQYRPPRIREDRNRKATNAEGMIWCLPTCSAYFQFEALLKAMVFFHFTAIKPVSLRPQCRWGTSSIKTLIWLPVS